jgi:RHS repeat-associated protein
MIPEQVSKKFSESIRSLLRRLIQYITILLLVLPTVAAADVVQGRFTHRIPIKIPPGTNGMQPNLALTYDSGRGNGDVGMGWALEGMSYIGRCNYGNGIKYANGSGINSEVLDTYCHSDLGVLVKLADGTYRSKKESFTKFVPLGTCGDGPCSWVAYDRTGVQLKYGTTANSREMKDHTYSVRRWGLKEVVDLFGNSYQVNYLEYFSASEIIVRIYPKEISYTIRNDLNTFRVVQLQYETRTDTEGNFIQSDFFDTALRLKRIIIKSSCKTTSCTEGTPIRTYQLDYQCGDSTSQCPATATGRSRLVAVTEIGSDGSKLPPQTFGWTPNPGASQFPGTLPPQAAFSGLRYVSELYSILEKGFDRGTRIADLNGDGRPDLIRGYAEGWFSTRTAWINSGAGGWVETKQFAPPSDFVKYYTTSGTVNDLGLRLVDLNADGLPDLLQALETVDTSTNPPTGTLSMHAWINNGGIVNGQQCTTQGCAWVQTDSFAIGATGQLDPKSLPVFAGRADHYNESHNYAPYNWDGGLRIVDLNGDLRPDLIWACEGCDAYRGNQYVMKGALLNTGKQFVKVRSDQYIPPVDFVGFDKDTAPGGWDNGLRLVDLDGDGKPDLLWAARVGTTTFHSAWRNTNTLTNSPYVGDAWDDYNDYDISDDNAFFTWRNSWTQPSYDGGLQMADINGDGKADLVYKYQTSSYNTLFYYSGAWINTGNGWISDSGYSKSIQSLPNDVNFSSCDTWYKIECDAGLRIVDLNGDGKADLIWGKAKNTKSTSGVWINNGYGWIDKSSLYALPSNFQINASNYYATPSGEWDSGVRFADLTGKGRPDILWGFIPADSQSSSLAAQVNYAWQVPADPDLMTLVSNGIGGTVTVTYTPAALVPGAIVPGFKNLYDLSTANTFAKQLVTKLATTDGRGGNYNTTCQYTDARLYSTFNPAIFEPNPGTIPNRRDLGFATMTVIDGQTGQYTTTTYNQSPGLAGYISEVDVFSSNNQLVTSTSYTYDLVQPDPGTEFVREKKKTISNWESGVMVNSQTTTVVSFDDYGNPTVVDHEAAAPNGASLSTFTVTTGYINDTTNWILGRISSVMTTQGSNLLSFMFNTWTGNNITAKTEWLSTTGGLVNTQMTYYANGNLKKVIEPSTDDGLIRTTTIEYDDTYQAYPKKITNALKQSTQMAYWPDGQVWTTKDANQQTTTRSYDAFGRLQQESRPDGGSTTYSYLNKGSDPVTNIAGAFYNTTTTTVDASRSITKTEYIDGSGFTYWIQSTSDCSQGTVVQSQKDSAGRPYKTSNPFCSGSSDTIGWTTTLYDEAGRVKTVTRPDNKAYLSNYTHSGWYLQTNVTDPNLQMTREYLDARGNVRAIADAFNQMTYYDYDPLGRLTSVKLPNNAETKITYDSLNRKTSVTDPQLGLTSYSYDNIGNLKSVTSGGKTVTYTYDALNRVKTKQPGNEGVVTYLYDNAGFPGGIGRITTLVDSTGTTYYAYDSMGRVSLSLKGAIDNYSYVQTYSYDYAGRTTQIQYPEGSLVDYTYTNGSNLATIKLNGTTMATWSNYTANGKPQKVTYGNGVDTTYHYDVINHLDALSTTKGSNTFQNLTYDWYSLPNTGGINIGSITDHRATTWVNGIPTDESQTYTYDSLYRLTQATGVWGTKSYAYDSIGNVKTFDGVINRTLNYTGQQVTSGSGLSTVKYDTAGNMTQKTLDGITSTYGWSAENRLTSVSSNKAWSLISYDADGQRAIKWSQVAGGPGVFTTYIGDLYEKRMYSESTPTRVTIHLFANGQRIASVTKAGSTATAFNTSNQWRGEVAMASLYDGGSVTGLAHKAFHLLKAAALHPNAARWVILALFGAFAAWILILVASPLIFRTRRFSYSSRIRLAAASILIIFSFTYCSDGGLSNSAISQDSNYLLRGETTKGPALGTYFYHTNHINSSSVITDTSGAEVTRIVYLPFGEISQLNSTGGDTVTKKFTGQEFDEDTGLYYYGSRYYDPVIGRFLSPDSIIPNIYDAQSFNRYSYVRNNPIIHIDPSGHQEVDVGGGDVGPDLGGGEVGDGGTEFSTTIVNVPTGLGYIEVCTGPPELEVCTIKITARRIENFTPQITSVPTVYINTVGAPPSWRLPPHDMISATMDYSRRISEYAGFSDSMSFQHKGPPYIPIPWMSELMDLGYTEPQAKALIDMINMENRMASINYHMAWIGGTAFQVLLLFFSMATGESGGIAGIAGAERTAAAGEMEALGTRAMQIHGALDPIAADMRTTAVMSTKDGINIIAGGARDLTPAQRAMLGPGEVAAKLPGVHAEITAVRHAAANGLTPQTMTVTRTICPSCAAAIQQSGGTLLTPRTVIWLK